MADQDLYRPIKRIRQACQNCRRKKARCTGERPECAFCVRLGQSCSYSDDGEPNNSTIKVGSKDFDASSYDLSERLSALEGQMVDVAQTLKNIATTVQSISRTISTSPNTGAPSAPSIPLPDTEENSPYTGLPSLDIIRAACELYFRFCHNQPYSLFHEPSLRNKIELEELPSHLLFALLASTVRYSSNPFFEDKKATAVSAYAAQSWKSIVMPWNGMQSEGELSIVQTILLLAIIDYTEGRTQASWIKVGLAIRLAQDFRLMVEPDSDLPLIQQEERRRVFWSFYLCDKLISCGRERPAALADDQCKLHLPCDDNEWKAGNCQQTLTLRELSGETSNIAALSPFAITIVMSSLLGRCAQYALGEQEEQTPGGKMHPWNPRSKYSLIHSSLLQLESELGLTESVSAKITHSFANVDGTIDHHRASPLVLAHALFFLCQCLLYHPFLLRQRLIRLGQRTPQSFLAQTFQSCRSAAGSLSHLMDDVKTLECETLTTHYDAFYGYCTMVAGTIHSMFLQAADPLVAEAANQSFESSIRNLAEMSYYWKSCGMMRSRLEDFRQCSSRYTQLVDATLQEVQLTQADANDLLECLDYSRMSTTPRRKSELESRSHLATLSQLRSPFFEEFVNLLPISHSRPKSTFPGITNNTNDDIFDQQQQSLFDSTFAFPSSTASLYPNISLASIGMLHNNIIMNPDDTGNMGSHSSSTFTPSSSRSYSLGLSPTDQSQSISHITPPTVQGGDAGYVGLSQHNNMSVRKLTSPNLTFKRPWYEPEA